MTAVFGYTIIYVSDVEATLNFFKEGFGLQPKLLTPERDYGELETGTTTLAFASHELGHANFDSSGGFAPIEQSTMPVGFSVTLLTADVSGTLAAALAAGATQYTEPMEKPWGQTVAYIRDPNGLLVEVATPVAQ